MRRSVLFAYRLHFRLKQPNVSTIEGWRTRRWAASISRRRIMTGPWKLNQNFADAALNRGVVRYQLGRHNAARRDLNRALALAPSRQVRGIIHYNLALIDLAVGNRESCTANLNSALELGNPDAQALGERLHPQPRIECPTARAPIDKSQSPGRP